MKVIVLGAGMQGTACAYDLLLSEWITQVGLFDQDLSLVKKAEEALLSKTKSKTSNSLITGKIDVNDHPALVEVLTDYDVVVSAVPYFLNLKITQAAIEAKTHMTDMGGNTDLVFEQRKLNEDAIKNDVTILPDCGLAPGLANMIAAHGIQQFDTVDTVEIRVGGLPQHPVPPLNYQLFFSIHGLINEYIGDAVILRNGRQETVPTLTGLENVQLDCFDEVLEAVITLGGLSTLPWTFEGKVQSLDYKTLRYPGHWHVIESMNTLGLFNTTPVEVNGSTVSPREVTANQMTRHLDWRHQGGRIEDIVLVKIKINGIKNSKPSSLEYEMMDHYDEASNFTAMMRCTAFPVSIVAQMLASGAISARGVATLEETVCGKTLMNELTKRHIHFHVNEREISSVSLS